MTISLYLGGLLLGFAWFLPLSVLGAIVCCASFLIFCAAVQVRALHNARAPYGALLLSGMLAHLFGFYWIFGTIRQFGEFPALGALLVFLFFIFASSLQFPLFYFLRAHLPTSLDRYALRSPLAWVTVELIAIRIFPWGASHPLAAFPSLIQLAEWGGSALNSFAFIWILELLAQGLIASALPRIGVSFAAAIAVAAYGSTRISQLESAPGKRIPVALVQGAISLEQKHNRDMSRQNLLEYQTLSEQFDKPGTLIVWPETVLTDWIAENVAHVANDRRMPQLKGGASLIFGSLTYRSRNELFNSAFAIGPSGEVPLPYHKRILMPFGEFTPFGKTFPYLRTLNNIGGDFTEGSGTPLLTVPLRSTGEAGNGNGEYLNLQVTPLICYEDVLPQIASEGTNSGAQLLVNLTNDAWFGESIAPLQHHQIALLRAVENRRSLVRATNTGLSAVVAPTGKTTLRIRPFEKAGVNGEVELRQEAPPFVRYPIQRIWKCLALLCSCLSIFGFFTISRKGG